MDSEELLNRFCSTFARPSYLEIGLSHAETFRKVKASEKTGVDPKFHFDPNIFRDSLGISLHRKTSDDFFTSQPHSLYDLIFIDGLHTADQVIRDFSNSLVRLKRDGFIVIDDILPNDYFSTLDDQEKAYSLRKAYPQLSSQRRGDWHGSVFKALPIINALFARINIFLILNNIENPKAIVCHCDNSFVVKNNDIQRMCVASSMTSRWPSLLSPSDISYAGWLEFISHIPTQALDATSLMGTFANAY